MESVSAVLYVCSLDAVLWGHLPVLGDSGQPQHSKCVRATASEEGQATSAFPPPFYLLTPHLPSHNSSSSLGSSVKLSSSETGEAGLGTVGFPRENLSPFPWFRKTFQKTFF